MRKLNFNSAILAAAAVFAIAALLFYLLFSPGNTVLVLADCDTGNVYTCFDVSDGDEFSIAFIHSVNKSEVREYYTIYSDEIYLEKCLYSDFGAGVATEIEDGQSLSYTEDGKMLISNIHMRIDKLSYIVGTVSDHILYINGKEISLRALCGKNSPVEFNVKKVGRFFIWRNSYE
ncbi:DUF1850 domain-containing protein [Lachnospiraceae bacterium NSJ-143]|nr:DUF1850 domain-containing protein [Lachnospiraceae bacterium NSJ-143]